MTSGRVEVQVRCFCTHPDAKEGEGCPMEKGQWKCVFPEAGENGEASVCDYFEVEAVEKKETKT